MEVVSRPASSDLPRRVACIVPTGWKAAEPRLPRIRQGMAHCTGRKSAEAKKVVIHKMPPPASRRALPKRSAIQPKTGCESEATQT